jgi:predicted lipase
LDTASVVYPFCDSCRVHQGFYNAYKGVAPLVQPLAKKLISSFSNAKFYITGHSLGGAMAIHCALDMRQIGIHVDAVYTFGQPRVGNQNFANFQGQLTEVYRLINYADIVPHVPPSSFGFKHGNPEIWYTPRGMKNYKVCVPEDPTCSNSIPTTQLSTDDHSIKNY